MNTVEFLRFVLPQQGLYFSATPHSFIDKDGKEVSYYKHAGYHSVAELAEHCVDLSNDGKNAFFACSSFKEEFIEVERKGKIKQVQRVQENAAFARAQWVDIDCGNDEYPTQKDGLAGLVKFCRETRLPVPNAVVSSGNGIHCYWVFDEDVPAVVWTKAAKIFKAIQARFNFAQTDTTRSADVASVLRPVGTNNDKSAKGKGIKPVEYLVPLNKKTIPFKAWAASLVELRNKYGIVVPKGKQAPSKNSALSGGMNYDPSDAEKVANRCKQIRIFRDNLGVGQDEPTWRACLGVVGYCADGETYATTWSSGYESYDEDATLDKMQQWMDNAGPTTCEHFRGCNPSACEGCIWQGKIISPIVLGRPDPEHRTEVTREIKVDVVSSNEETGEVVVEKQTQQVVDHIPPFPESVEKSYRWNGEALVVKKQAEDGSHDWVPFCSQLPIIDERFFCKDDKCWKYHVRALVRPGTWNEGDIKASDLSRGGVALLGALGGSLGVVPRGIGTDLVSYMRTWAEAVTYESEEVAMHNHFGWYPDGSFLLGTKKYMADGTTRQVRTSASLSTYIHGFEPKGTLQRHIELIDRAYNRPNHEMYQFTYLSGFASILLRRVHGSACGVPLVTYSRETGYGKTTAAKAALSIYGDPHAQHQMAAANKVTEYALYRMAGTRRDLPMVLDEVTMWDAKRAAGLAYSYSDGIPKVQGQATGGLRDNSDVEWANIMIMTGNRSVVQDMIDTTSDCAAQVSRVIEYQYNTSHDETLGRSEGQALFDELWLNTGVVGDVYVQHVVKNIDRIVARCKAVRDELADEAGVDKGGRFWLLATACIWVSYEIALELGMVRFDRAALRKWIVSHIQSMMGSAMESNSDMLAMFGDMMAEMQRGLIVTDTEGDRRSGKPASFLPGFGVPHGTITGRAIQDKKLVYLSHSAMRDWCVKRGVSTREMENQLTAKGWMKNVQRVALGKGTVLSVPQTKCALLDWAAFESHLTTVTNGVEHAA